MSKQFKLSEEALNAALAYLGNCPYKEVFQIIPPLHNAELIEEEAEEGESEEGGG